MSLQEIKQAIKQGKTVYWSNIGYIVKKVNEDYYIVHHTGDTVGLTGQKGTEYENQLNGEENDFHIFSL